MRLDRLVFGLAALVLLTAAEAFAKGACDADAVAGAKAAVAAACPCDAQADGTSWKNHGAYVSCVAHARKTAAAEAGIKKSCLTDVQPCAAESTCGRASKVACSAPSDVCLFAPGACSSNIAEPCATAADCTNAGDTCKAVGACAVSDAACFDDTACDVASGESCVFTGTCEDDPAVVCHSNTDCGDELCFVATAEDCDAANGSGTAGSCCDVD